MAKLTSDEIVTQKHKRSFIQFGGALPNSPVKYAGQDSQYMFIGGVKLNESGGIKPIRVPDPKTQGKFKLVGRSFSAPDLDSATLVVLEKHGSIPWQLFNQNCQFNFYELTGTCKDLSDFNNGWSDYVFVYSGGVVTAKDLGNRTTMEGDDQIEDSLSITLGAAYPVGSLSFEDVAKAQVTAKISDVVYGTQIRCGDCGISNDGTRFIYAVQDGTASPAAKPKVFYSLDYGATWQTVDVATATNAETVVAMDIVGNSLVLLSPLGGVEGASALYVSTINTVTGAPSSTFVKVTPATFDSPHAMRDMFVLSTSEVFFIGNLGYILKSSDVLTNMSIVDAGNATTQNLNRIHGIGDTLYAVGEGAPGVIVKSNNRGQSWATTTTNPVASFKTAVFVKDKLQVWLGTAAGVVYYTLDGGETWVAAGYTAQSAANVDDIQFASDEVGYIAFTAASAGHLASTFNGGASWADDSQGTPRLGALPTSVELLRIATPASGSPATDTNFLAVCGAGAASDGALIIGQSNKL